MLELLKKLGNKVVGPYGEEMLNDSGQYLIEVCKRNEYFQFDVLSGKSD